MRMTESTWNQSAIGFERLFELMRNPVQVGQSDHYPPYDVEKTEQTAYTIRLAVAGFSADELTITWQPNLLTVSGKKAQNPRGRFLYRGIATRAFRRQFHLADNMRVAGAVLDNGMLAVELVHDVPDAPKLRRIEIANGNPPWIEGKIAA
jgi:molecular chaperone IbpA